MLLRKESVIDDHFGNQLGNDEMLEEINAYNSNSETLAKSYKQMNRLTVQDQKIDASNKQLDMLDHVFDYKNNFSGRQSTMNIGRGEKNSMILRQIRSDEPSYVTTGLLTNPLNPNRKQSKGITL